MSVTLCRIIFDLSVEKQMCLFFVFFTGPKMFSLLPLFAYMTLERHRTMNDVSLDLTARPLILIFRL